MEVAMISMTAQSIEPLGKNPPWSQKVLGEWVEFTGLLKKEAIVELCGSSLTIPIVVAVARHGTPVAVKDSGNIAERLAASVDLLSEKLRRHESIYGVTTGFGGSANTHTDRPRDLQTALLQMQHSGVLPLETTDPAAYSTLCMPPSWVKAAILVRSNSLLRGHSAVRLEVIEKMLSLLEHQVTPLVPLRGSISASGDLCPLSYIAGALEGNPDIKVWVGSGKSPSLIASHLALQAARVAPVKFGPKETLGVLNGTAFSVAVASVAQHEAQILAVFAQVLTAMGVEALLGSAESFHPIFSKVRPHRGQAEISANIRMLLRGSALATDGITKELPGSHLRQDRYPLRTSAQWLGPFVEDLELAQEQLQIELNSTTDNPLVDVGSRRVLHGGNFQATAVTSATEKTRTALEKIGKMIFSQSTELLDERLTFNLPPNLAVDEPSLSYTMKGVDINMAAYMSELAFLGNPVSNHVQSAEMCNQALNSLALISARYTHMAIDIVSLMLSAYLYTLCQALDLRAMNELFMQQLNPKLGNLMEETLSDALVGESLTELKQTLWLAIAEKLAETTTMDSAERFIEVAKSSQYHVVEALHASTASKPPADSQLFLVTSWTARVADLLRNTFCSNRASYIANFDASPYLGLAANRMYNFIRKELNIPMHRGLVDHPTLASGASATQKKTTGTQISIIYHALREGRLAVPIMECLKEALELRKEEGIFKAKL